MGLDSGGLDELRSNRNDPGAPSQSSRAEGRTAPSRGRVARATDNGSRSRLLLRGYGVAAPVLFSRHRVSRSHPVARATGCALVLSHSRRPAIVWSRSQDQVSWIACHNRAFERLGGIPAVNRIDNPKTAIATGAGAWGTIHPTYAAYARTVGFHVDACAPREPQQKGKTEAKVRLFRGLFASLGRRFDGLEHLQHESDERVERWSERPICPATGKSVRESWEAERAYLRPPWRAGTAGRT